MNILKNKKSKIILLVCCIFIVVAITGGLVTYFILANKDKTQKIIISFVDSKATFSLGKHNNIKVTDFNKNFNNCYELEFQTKEDRKNFEIQEINNSPYLIKNSNLKIGDSYYNVYFDVNGYRFRVFEGQKGTENSLYIEGVRILTNFIDFSDFNFIPFICPYSTPFSSGQNCQYNTFNEYFNESSIHDYESLKKEIIMLPQDLIQFNDDEKFFCIKSIIFPSMSRLDDNSALKIKCYDDYFSLSKIML